MSRSHPSATWIFILRKSQISMFPHYTNYLLRVCWQETSLHAQAPSEYFVPKNAVCIKSLNGQLQFSDYHYLVISLKCIYMLALNQIYTPNFYVASHHRDCLHVNTSQLLKILACPTAPMLYASNSLHH